MSDCLTNDVSSIVCLLGIGMLSRSSSVISTYESLLYSNALTTSSWKTSRSSTGHQRFCLRRLLHSLCRVLKARSLLSVAPNSLTGMEIIPKVMAPFQMGRGMTGAGEFSTPDSRVCFYEL